MSKTEIWDALAKTDPNQTKGFKRAGGFSGTAVKPIWCVKRMTEQFGACGTGWGMNEPQFQVVPGHNGEVLVYCTVSLWYGDGKTVFGVGGDKVVTYIKANEQYGRPERWENDDEAFKKAFTDALTNAMKHIGMAADIHMGLFDDNKYVNGLRQEFAEEAAAKAPARQQPRAEPVKQPNPAYVVKGGKNAAQWVDLLAGIANQAPDDAARQEIAAANGDALAKLKNASPADYDRAMKVLGTYTQEGIAA